MKKKPAPYKPQTFFIDSGTWRKKVLVIVNQPNDATKKTLLKYYDLEAIEESKILKTYSGKAVQFNNCNLLVRFNDLYPNDPHSLGVIAHECFHLTEFLFDFVGIKYDIDTSGEAFAYQIDHYCRKILENLK